MPNLFSLTWHGIHWPQHLVHRVMNLVRLLGVTRDTDIRYIVTILCTWYLGLGLVGRTLLC